MPKRPSPAACAIVLAIAALLAGCESISAGKIPGIYRLDVQQGNVVTQEMIDQLEPGMEKRKVRYILGTPMIMDTFNADRWDYLYSFEPGGGARTQRRISVFFENDRLSRVEGDVTPRSGPATVPVRADRVVTVPDPEEDGFFRGLTKRFGGGENDPQPEPTAPAPSSPQPAGEPAR